MAFKSVCKDQKLPALPAEVARIIETFAQSDHHAAFTLKYGRVRCDPFPGMQYELVGDTIPKLQPGFDRFVWSVEAHELRAGMEIIFVDRMTGHAACILKDVFDSGFTYVREGVETTAHFVQNFYGDRGHPPHQVYARCLYLFVESPGAYMRFVGRDRYTGDLTDLLPLKEGEEMSELEENIREFYEDRLDEANRED